MTAKVSIQLESISLNVNKKQQLQASQFEKPDWYTQKQTSSSNNIYSWCPSFILFILALVLISVFTMILVEYGSIGAYNIDSFADDTLLANESDFDITTIDEDGHQVYDTDFDSASV